MISFFNVSYLIILIFIEAQRLGLILRHCDMSPQQQKQAATSCSAIEILIDRMWKSGLSLLAGH
jgi:hypothetical protein